MTLALVYSYAVHPVAALENGAEAIANAVADPYKGDIEKHSRVWACAFHHAIDLMAYARGCRRTTRCMPDYVPNDVELKVEAILADREIYRGMREEWR